MKWLVKVVALGWVAWGVVSLISFLLHGRFHTEYSALGPGVAFLGGLARAIFPAFIGVGLWNRSAWAWWWAVIVSGLGTVLVVVVLVKQPKAITPVLLAIFASVVCSFVVLVVDAVLEWRRDGFAALPLASDPMRSGRAED